MFCGETPNIVKRHVKMRHYLNKGREQDLIVKRKPSPVETKMALFQWNNASELAFFL